MNEIKLASAPMRGTVILDSRGKPAQFNAAGSASSYVASNNDRFRTFYGGTSSLTETDMLSQDQRVSIISYLRRSLRNNPLLAAIARTYAETIGTPTVHCVTEDEEYNDQREKYLNEYGDRIMQPYGQDLRTFSSILSIEELIAGEWFLIEQPDGTVQFIPSELCGSPTASQKQENEQQGIIYWKDGRIRAYRFGVRLNKNSNFMQSRISYRIKDGAQIIPAARVIHGGEPIRVEER